MVDKATVKSPETKYSFALQLLERFGFPLFVMLAMLLGVWYGVEWLGREVLTPLTRTHVETLHVMQEALKSHDASLKDIREILRQEQVFALERMKISQEILVEQRKTTEAVRAVESKQP
jgi:uncharacterized membrane protein YfbV (UPF0208 family)